MSTYRVIDADGHVMETHPKAIGWAQNIEEPYRSQAPRHIPFRTGGGRTFLEGKIWPMPFPGADRDLDHDDFAVHVEREGMYDPHPRIKDMDIDGVDTAVLFGGVLALAVSGLDDPGLAVAVAVLGPLAADTLLGKTQGATIAGFAPLAPFLWWASI